MDEKGQAQAEAIVFVLALAALIVLFWIVGSLFMNWFGSPVGYVLTPVVIFGSIASIIILILYSTKKAKIEREKYEAEERKKRIAQAEINKLNFDKQFYKNLGDIFRQ